MYSLSQRFKFYTKIAVFKLRTFFFLWSPVNATRDGWDDRLLLINLDLIGDMVMFTAILRHYRNALPGKKLFLLINGSSGVSAALVSDYVDEVILINTEAFKKNLLYGYRFIKKLRRIGFATVVEHNPGVEFVGKAIAVELGAKEVIGYEGLAIDEVLPPSINFSLGLSYFHQTLSKKFTKIIPAIPEPNVPRRLAHMILHYAAIFEEVTGQKIPSYMPLLPASLPSDEPIKKLLADHHLQPFSYCLVSLGTSTPHKEWPVERFVALAALLKERNIPIVLTGGKKDIFKSRKFIELFQGECLDFTGKTSILEAASLVRYSLLAISNDTSIAHFAIAYKRPSLTMLWLAQPGRTSIYGYRDINRWVFKEDFPCFCDNGRCVHDVGPDDPAPCVAAITVEDAKQALRPLLDTILGSDSYPRENFSLAV